jgi:hypothetical protein
MPHRESLSEPLFSGGVRYGRAGGLVILVFFFAASVLCVAQETSTIKVDVNLVNVFVTVTDEHDTPVGSLQKENCRGNHRRSLDQTYQVRRRPAAQVNRPRAMRMRARWCQLCRSAWFSMTNCAVTGAPKLSEKGAARSNSSSVNARTAAAASRLFLRKASSAAAFVTPLVYECVAPKLHSFAARILLGD